MIPQIENSTPVLMQNIGVQQCIQHSQKRKHTFCTSPHFSVQAHP